MPATSNYPTPPARMRPSGRALGEQRMVPQTGITLEHARTLISALHFAKEALTQQERDILYLAEGLLRLIDAGDENGV